MGLEALTPTLRNMPEEDVKNLKHYATSIWFRDFTQVFQDTDTDWIIARNAAEEQQCSICLEDFFIDTPYAQDPEQRLLASEEHNPLTELPLGQRKLILTNCNHVFCAYCIACCVGNGC